MKAVILAGGRGKRLAPYTTVLPKPMMPLGEGPVLEVLIHALKARGFDEFVLAVGYMHGLIRAYFGDGEALGVKIRYSLEDQPLGTAGPISLIDGLDETFLVINGDVLSTLPIDRLLSFHRGHDGLATVAVSHRVQKIDYGVINLEGQLIREYVEKPSHDYKVSMGIYVFDPGILEWIPRGKHLDFPDLINHLLAAGEKVRAYVSADYWLDIGRPDDYARAQEQFESVKEELYNGKGTPISDPA